jgi:hypothetical protein
MHSNTERRNGGKGLREALRTILETSRKYPREHFPMTARGFKLGEEYGEFNEATNHKLGYLPHKTLKEPVEGEAADLIICVVDILQTLYAEKTNDEFLDLLEYQLMLKNDKWDKLIASNYESKPDE